MNEQDKILKDVIYNINKTNHELNRLRIILKDSNSAIVTNNKLDNDSQININQKEYK